MKELASEDYIKNFVKESIGEASSKYIIKSLEIEMQ